MKGKLLASIAVAVAGLSLIVGFVSYRAIAMTSNQMWQPLTELVTSEKLSEIVAESTAPGADNSEIATSAIGYEQGGLLLVDFNTPTLCGFGGCALAGYRTSTGERVLTVYVKRTHPDGPIVEVVEKEGFDLPCLFVPPDPNDENFFAETERDILCYQDGVWEIQ